MTTRSRASERPRPSSRARRDTRPFLERHRGAVVGAIVVAVVVVVSGFVFFQATQPAYACSSIFDPPEASSPSGAPEPDRGQTHVNPGTFITYDFCPPASGPHVNANNLGPIAPRYYGPDEQTVPQGWVHNLEHGGFVLLYRCESGACDDPTQQQLRQFAQSFPKSPVCAVPSGVISPVVTRFDKLPHQFAAIVWDRVMYMDTWDPERALAFFSAYAERYNPEKLYCTPPPSVAPSAASSADASASPAPSSSPAASPSPAASDAASASPS